MRLRHPHPQAFAGLKPLEREGLVVASRRNMLKAGLAGMAGIVEHGRAIEELFGNPRRAAMRSIVAFLLLAATTSAVDPRVHRDLAYTEPKNARQTLDVYAPAEGKGHPVVFWIHGGGWASGDEGEADAKPRGFVDKGYVFVSTNYRLIPEASIQQMAGDVAKAIRWTREHAEVYGGDPDAIFVMGHSAGAQLAALVCTDDRYLKAEGLSPSALKGCVPVDGDTYDVPMQVATVEERRAKSYRQKFGDGESQKALSPITHARGKGIPPFLILHVATHPETKAQSEKLAEALRGAGVPARAYPAEGKNHGTINSDLGKPGDEPTKAVLDFLGASGRIGKTP